MESTSKYSIGFKFGLIGAAINCVLLWIRFKYFATDPLSFGGFSAFSYIFFLVFYYFAGVARRKQLGGHANFKEIFQAILLVVILTEVAYAVFSYIYLSYIEPGFFERFVKTSDINFRKAGWAEDKIKMQLDNLKNIFPQLSPANILQGMGMWIVIDCIFGLIFSSFLKKTRKENLEKV